MIFMQPRTLFPIEIEIENVYIFSHTYFISYFFFSFSLTHSLDGETISINRWWFNTLFLFLFHYVIFAFFIVCRASFSRSFFLSNIPAKIEFIFFSFSFLLMFFLFFACLCFQQCMSLIAKIFLLFISISFFMLSWIRIEVTTRKRVCVCVYVCRWGGLVWLTEKNKSKKRRSKNDIYLPFSSGKI